MLGSTLATWPFKEVPLVRRTLTVRPIKADAIVLIFFSLKGVDISNLLWFLLKVMRLGASVRGASVRRGGEKEKK